MANLLADTEFAGNHRHLLGNVITCYMRAMFRFSLHDATGKPFQIQPFRVGCNHRVIGSLTELFYKLYITSGINCGIGNDFLK